VSAFDRPFGALVRGATFAGRPLMRLLGHERPPRALFDSERALLTTAIGEGVLDLDRVRVIFARSLDTWVPGEGHVARAIGDVIYIPSDDLHRDEDLSRAQASTLVHEACHVVQFQRGGSVYIGDSVRAQLACLVRGRPRGEAYDWRGPLARGAGFADLGAEAQARLVEESHAIGAGDEAARRALEEARAGRGWCGSMVAG